MMVSGYDLVSLEAKQGPSCGLASGPCAYNYNAAIEIDMSFLFDPLSLNILTQVDHHIHFEFD